jgi:SAM-dependent methyltransferase
VLHECPDAVKRALLGEVRRILRRGGTLVLTDTSQDDLHGYRGFYEPYKEECSASIPTRCWSSRASRWGRRCPWRRRSGRASRATRVERRFALADYSSIVRDSAERFFNRELSWLDFDRRVLELARDASRPILERAKFLAIFARNLDEFFQVRVSELQDLVAERDETPAPTACRPPRSSRRSASASSS